MRGSAMGLSVWTVAAVLALVLAAALVDALVIAGDGQISGTPVTEHQWEGSAEQKAFSEFNHHLSGIFLLGIGGLFLLKEQGVVPRRWLALWPFGLLFLAGYLVVWSDHDAWPIGPQSFAQTFFSGDLETIQHKLYAVVLFALGALEWARLEGRVPQWGNLVFFGIVAFAGLLMLHHSHLMAHNHHSPALLSDHVLLGALTIGSAGVKLAWERQWTTWRHGGLLWPGSVLLIGTLLVIYTE